MHRESASGKRVSTAANGTGGGWGGCVTAAAAATRAATPDCCQAVLCTLLLTRHHKVLQSLLLQCRDRQDVAPVLQQELLPELLPAVGGTRVAGRPWDRVASPAAAAAPAAAVVARPQAQLGPDVGLGGRSSRAGGCTVMHMYHRLRPARCCSAAAVSGVRSPIDVRLRPIEASPPGRGEARAKALHHLSDSATSHRSTNSPSRHYTAVNAVRCF